MRSGEVGESYDGGWLASMPRFLFWEKGLLQLHGIPDPPA